MNAEHRLNEVEDTTRRPGLRNVRAEVLDWKVVRVTRNTSVQLGEAVAYKITRRRDDVVGDPSRFFGESVALHAQGNDSVVVWPDGP